MQKNRKFIDYHKYLASDEWRKKKEHWIKLFGNDCICGKVGTDLHHRHYKNLGTEPPHQLILLCRNCHYLTHGGEIFTTDHKIMRANLRRLLRLSRTPIKAAAPLGERNTSAIQKKGGARMTPSTRVIGGVS